MIWGYYGKTLALWGLATVNFVLSQAVDTSIVGQLLGGTMTLAGMTFLVWKLVSDHRIETHQREIYDSIIETLQEERDALRKENESLRHHPPTER